MSDMLDLLGGTTAEDAKDTRLIFKDNEKVEFQCVEPKLITNERGTQLALSSRVLSGEHAGKPYTIFVRKHAAVEPPEENKKQAWQMRKKEWADLFFNSGFWTQDELKTGNPPLSRLAGRKFCAVAGKAREGENGKFQDIKQIRDLGAGDAAAAGGTPAQQQAATVAGQTSF